MALIGIDPTSVVPLSLVEGHLVDSVPNAQERFQEVGAAWIESRYGAEYFRWPEHWHYAPYDLLARAFCREELIRLWHSCIFMCPLDDHFQGHDPLVWKVQHSLWRYGGSKDYNRFVTCYNGLGRIAVDLPGFDVRVTHTRYINTVAWTAHGGDRFIYLDASFGVLLHYKGEHVMTIGFALSRQGILAAQVQLRKRRGNKWLYKLPMPHLDFALDILTKAFPDDVLYLVTGASTVAGIRVDYGTNSLKLASETAERVERFYDRPLSNYERTEETVQGSGDGGRMFVRLRPGEGSSTVSLSVAE